MSGRNRADDPIRVGEHAIAAISTNAFSAISEG